MSTSIYPFVGNVENIELNKTVAEHSCKMNIFTFYQSYQKAKAIMQLTFGSKVHKDFPRKYLDSETCGFKGFWESTGKGHYMHPGVDVDVKEGAQVKYDYFLFVCTFHLSLIIPLHIGMPFGTWFESASPCE